MFLESVSPRLLSLRICVCQVASILSSSVTLWTVACHAPLSMGFSRQEYFSGLPCPPPGDLSDPGIKLASPVAPALQVDSLPLSHWGKSFIPSLVQIKHFHISIEVAVFINIALCNWQERYQENSTEIS